MDKSSRTNLTFFIEKIKEKNLSKNGVNGTTLKKDVLIIATISNIRIKYDEIK